MAIPPTGKSVGFPAEIFMNEKYYLRYQNKWMIIKRILGKFDFELTDDKSLADNGTETKMLIKRSAISQDCNIPEEQITLVLEDAI